MYLPRRLEDAVRSASGAFPVVLLTGPRQSGKTTLLRHVAQADGGSRGYVTLDEFGLRRLAREDPALFFQRFPPPVLVDEIQHAPELLSWIKVLVDREPERRGAFWLTGSQHFAMAHGVAESLAGRVAVLRLLGLSHSEELGIPGATQPFRPDRAAGDPPPLPLLRLFARIVRGTLPRLALPDAPPRDLFYSSYLQTWIERDVLSLTAVHKLSEFETFLRACAARTAQLVDLSGLARDCGIAASTTRDWLSLLVANAQILLLRPYHRNLGKRQTKTPKLYFLDSGLAAWLCGWTDGPVAAAGAMAGALLETHVVGEIVRSYWHRGMEAPLWFWRTKEGHEVDVLVESDGRLFPVEVKLAAEPDRRAAHGIERLRASGAPLGPGAVVCLAERRQPLVEGVDVLPVGAIA